MIDQTLIPVGNYFIIRFCNCHWLAKRFGNRNYCFSNRFTMLFVADTNTRKLLIIIIGLFVWL